MARLIRIATIESFYFIIKFSDKLLRLLYRIGITSLDDEPIKTSSCFEIPLIV